MFGNIPDDNFCYVVNNDSFYLCELLIFMIKFKENGLYPLIKHNFCYKFLIFKFDFY